jgi:hypothetical protein
LALICTSPQVDKLQRAHAAELEEMHAQVRKTVLL